MLIIFIIIICYFLQITKPYLEIDECDIMFSCTSKSSWNSDEEIRTTLIKQCADNKTNLADKYCSLIEEFASDQTVNEIVGQIVDKAVAVFVEIRLNNCNIR